MRVVGHMSGTSLDGLDICFIHFNMDGSSFEILDALTLEYPSEIISLIKEAYHSTVEQIGPYDQEYSLWLASRIRQVIEHRGWNPDLISGHGHTIFHQPEKGLTYQIGNLALLAENIDIPVVCNFRPPDVLLGGQGAPLVPIGDALLFGQFTYCLNLGGFANVSFNKGGKRIAYDLSPCNLILNALVEKLKLNYDDRGQMAQGGKTIVPLLEELNDLPYFKLSPPKSLGREWLDESVFPLFDHYSEKPTEDLLHTAVEWMAKQIGVALVGKGTVLVTGGGAHNEYLIQRIQHYSESQLVIPEKNLIEFKEALIFGYLGWLRWHDRINVLASVTGARKDHSSGSVYVPSRRK